MTKPRRKLNLLRQILEYLARNPQAMEPHRTANCMRGSFSAGCLLRTNRTSSLSSPRSTLSAVSRRGKR